MRGNHQYESRVKRNAVIIYLLASLLCVAMIYYIVNLKDSINYQRLNITKNENILKLTNELIDNVNNSQTYADIYAFSNNKGQLTNFNISISKVELLKDSILELCDDSFNKDILNDIKTLLLKKEEILNDINIQLKNFNPYKEIYSIVDNYQSHNKKNTITKTVSDTIIYKPEKKNFFQRLGEVFSPGKSADSLVLLSSTTIDTIMEDSNDTRELLDDIQLYTEKGRKEYVRQLNLIEIKYNNLILSYRQISQELSDLLIILHKQTLNSVIYEIQKSELLINRNINLSILVACIALLIILTFIFLIFYDVRKVAEAHKATEEAKKRTEEIMESRHKLLLSVSHDIKVPLSSILGYIELMQIDNEKCVDKHKILSMKNSAEHILSLLNNLLNFSRLEQGKESIILSDFNINDICDELNDMFKPLAKSKHLSFVYQNKIKSDTYIKSDALKIKQIVTNILSNAIKYSAEGTIQFIAEINNDELFFNIKDEGIGIASDMLEEIYKPFSRIDNNKSSIEGSGFGLYVVKGLIDLMKGKIEVESELNKGSEFIIKIPIEIVDVPEKPEDIVTMQNIKSDTNQKVLIVDDDDVLLSVIESMVYKIGESCEICHSYIEFEEKLKNIDDYDLILTDKEMNDFNGLDVLKIIKEINPNKKVVLMTASSEYDNEIALSIGFDAYLRKPFTITSLSGIFKKDINVADDFPDLCTMFENDIDAIKEILRIFTTTTADNLLLLNKYVEEDDFESTVALCHKMCPMFVQLNQKEMSDFLYKMDGLRGCDKETFPRWKEETIKFMNNADDLISYLFDKYDID